MQFHSIIEFESSLIFLVILSRQVCFSPSTMALLHHHRQGSYFHMSFLVSSFPTSVTARSDFCFHRQLFPKLSYFCHISSGVPTVPHHFQCGGEQFRSEGRYALLPLPHGRYILVPNEKVGANAEVTTGRGQGWQWTTRRLP